jgi:hypothetical protein
MAFAIVQGGRNSTDVLAGLKSFHNSSVPAVIDVSLHGTPFLERAQIAAVAGQWVGVPG